MGSSSALQSLLDGPRSRRRRGSAAGGSAVVGRSRATRRTGASWAMTCGPRAISWPMRRSRSCATRARAPPSATRAPSRATPSMATRRTRGSGGTSAASRCRGISGGRRRSSTASATTRGNPPALATLPTVAPGSCMTCSITAVKDHRRSARRATPPTWCTRRWAPPSTASSTVGRPRSRRGSPALPTSIPTGGGRCAVCASPRTAGCECRVRHGRLRRG